MRMGLHTGEPTVGKERYSGIGVHRAARIGAAGDGGQVLLSNATRELVEDELPERSARVPSASFSSLARGCHPSSLPSPRPSWPRDAPCGRS